jgi:hypothetical protein
MKDPGLDLEGCIEQSPWGFKIQAELHYFGSTGVAT